MAACSCRALTPALLIGLLVAMGGTLTAGGSFTGDLAMSSGIDTLTGSIAVTEFNYRMDVRQGGEKFVVIADRITGMIRVLIPEKMQYVELKGHDRINLLGNPFQALWHATTTGKDETLGLEVINDLECDKHRVENRGRESFTFWVARKFGFPIRITSHASEGSFAEISNISEGPVSDTLFEIPADYKKMASPGNKPVEIPVWVEAVPQAPVVVLPVEQEMSAGEMLRIKVEPGKSVWVRANNQSQDAVAKAIPFRKGSPIKDVTIYSNFAEKGIVCDRRQETPAEADEIVVRVLAGTMTVEIKSVEMHEERLAEGKSLAFPLASSEYIDVRFVNGTVEPAECTWTFVQGGAEVPDERIGPSEQRTIVLEYAGEVGRRTLSPAGDTLVMKVESGEMIIKLGQFDSFAW
jgi:hypothetical protein